MIKISLSSISKKASELEIIRNVTDEINDSLEILEKMSVKIVDVKFVTINDISYVLVIQDLTELQKNLDDNDNTVIK